MLDLNYRILTAAAIVTTVPGVAAVAHAQAHSAWLYEGETVSFVADFLAGERIHGVCDGDCYDLDLLLYDSAGNLVAQDVSLGAAPVITVPFEGSFIVQASMPNCTHRAGCAAYFSSDHGFTVDDDRPIASNDSATAASEASEVVEHDPTASFNRSTATAPMGNASVDGRSVWRYSSQTVTVSGYFWAGETIRGTCDEDCLDLNLSLYDSTGNLVSEDVALDAEPVVTAPHNGQYILEVSMPSCSQSDRCEVEIVSEPGF